MEKRMNNFKIINFTKYTIDIDKEFEYSDYEVINIDHNIIDRLNKPISASRIVKKFKDEGLCEDVILNIVDTYVRKLYSTAMKETGQTKKDELYVVIDIPSFIYTSVIDVHDMYVFDHNGKISNLFIMTPLVVDDVIKAII